MIIRALSVLAMLVMLADAAVADIVRGIDIEFVAIRNAGNAYDPATLYGPVGYDYYIGKYEVTNAQWNAFTTLADTPSGNPSSAYDENAIYSSTQQPTNFISWYESVQFCNYLTTGDKSQGVYQFSGNNDNPGDFLGINRTSATETYGEIYYLPNEDEWYKAAYHKNDGVTGNYWLYPMQLNDTPSNDLINPDPGNNGNFYQDGYTIGSPDFLTDVGEFENSGSAYGTFDQGGNVREWTEYQIFGSFRIQRGGSCLVADFNMDARHWTYQSPELEYFDLGFRVASNVPEPTTLCLLLIGGIGVVRRHKR